MFNLQKIREKIDSIDHKILSLLNQRAGCALEVAKIKNKDSQTIYRPDREREILEALNKKDNILSPLAIKCIFKQIITGCRSIQRPDESLKVLLPSCRAIEKKSTVSCLGPEGTFSWEAAHLAFPHAKIQWQENFPKIFKQVQVGEVDYAVVPLENSTEGSVSIVLDLLREAQGVYICHEIDLLVRHNLLVSPNNKNSSINVIYAHQQALSQCKKWIQCHYPNARIESVSSNADGAKRVDGGGKAAIASTDAAQLYDLSIVASDIQDYEHNTTRFIVIGRHSAIHSQNDKTSIIVKVENYKGILADILQQFAQYDIDLTSIKTRPDLDQVWQYRFFIDFYGHIDDQVTRQALSAIECMGIDIKVLGSYGRDEIC